MIYFCKICNEPIEDFFVSGGDIPHKMVNIIMETLCEFHTNKLVPPSKRDLLTMETFNSAIANLLTKVARAMASGQSVSRCQIIGKGHIGGRCRNLVFTNTQNAPMVCGVHRGVLKSLGKNLDYYDLEHDGNCVAGSLTAALHTFFAHKEKAIDA